MRHRRRPFRLSIFLALVVIASSTAALADPSVFHDRLLTENPANGTPRILDGGRPDGVKAFAQIGSTMYAGGSFTQVSESSGPTITRVHIFAFDVNTGAISNSFVPQLNGKVESIQPAPGGAAVFVGGYFTTVNGQRAKRVAKIDTSNGQLVSGFTANVTTGDRVMDMSIHGNRLFLGGEFTKVNGQARNSFAAIDATTGALDTSVNITFAGVQAFGDTRIQRMDISPDGETIVAIGNFATVGGLDRRQVVKLNVGSAPATVANWATDRFKNGCSTRFDTYMRDVDIAPDGSYFIIGTTGAFFGGANAGVLCDTVTRWNMGESGSGIQPDWIDYTGGDTTWSVLSTGAAIYIGGHMRWMNNPFGADSAGPGSVPRVGTAALDPLNGLPLAWKATREPRREGVFKLYSTPDGVWFGSDSCCIAGERHERLALMPAGGALVPAPSVFHLPSEIWSMRYSTSSVNQIDHRSYSGGSTFGSTSSLTTAGIDWSQARGAFVTNGRLYHGRSDGTLQVRSFNSSSVGAASTVDLHGLTNTHFPLANVTGMFLHSGRLYYTVSGDSRLFYRYFSPSNDMVGAQTFTASTSSGGFDWGSAAGMTMVDRNIYVGRINGNLDRIGFSAGAPVLGSRTTISGPASDGRNWRSRALFIYS